MYLGIDKTLFEDIWRKHGPQKTKSEFPLVDIFVYKIYFQKILRMRVHHPLNLVKFVKAEAEQELNSKFGWKKFQHKHLSHASLAFMKISGYLDVSATKRDEHTFQV